MVVVFLLEQVVVFFDHHILPADHFCLPHTKKHLIVHLRSPIDQSQLSCIAVGHFLVQLPVKQKGDEEPIRPNESIRLILNK